MIYQYVCRYVDLSVSRSIRASMDMYLQINVSIDRFINQSTDDLLNIDVSINRRISKSTYRCISVRVTMRLGKGLGDKHRGVANTTVGGNACTAAIQKN